MILKQPIVHLINPEKHIKVKQEFQKLHKCLLKQKKKKTPMIQQVPTKSEGKPIHNQTRDSSILQHHVKIKLLQLKYHPQHQ